MEAGTTETGGIWALTHIQKTGLLIYFQVALCHPAKKEIEMHWPIGGCVHEKRRYYRKWSVCTG